MLEKVIEARLTREVKAIGGLCLKWVSPGFVGVPDRMILLPGGHIIFVELKAPGRKETMHGRQRYVQGLLRSMGFTVYSAVDSVDKVVSIVDKCKGGYA